jgi:hypothetical protein
MAEIYVFSMVLCRPVMGRALSSGSRIKQVDLATEHGNTNGSEAD